jgi:hypothetical protein
MPVNKNSHAQQTHYLDQVISIAQSPAPNRSWSYVIHSRDFSTTLSQKTGFNTYTQALNQAKQEVEQFVASV